MVREKACPDFLQAVKAGQSSYGFMNFPQWEGERMEIIMPGCFLLILGQGYEDIVHVFFVKGPTNLPVNYHKPFY